MGVAIGETSKGARVLGAGGVGSTRESFCVGAEGPSSGSSTPVNISLVRREGCWEGERE